MTDPRPEDDDRFAPRQFGDRFSRFESQPATEEPEETPAFERSADRETAHSGPRREFRGGVPGPARGFWSALFSFEGRATRGHYWAVFVVGTMLMLVPFATALGPLTISNPEAGREADITGGNSQPEKDPAQMESMVYLIWFPLTMVYAWVYCAVTVRRYHDRDKSGFWMMLLLVPVASIAVLLECGFLPGTNGSNQYGPNPREL